VSGGDPCVSGGDPCVSGGDPCVSGGDPCVSGGDRRSAYRAHFVLDKMSVRAYTVSVITHNRFI